MWAVGCVMGEMINNSPLFPGENDIDQLAVVLQALGTPTLESWPVRHAATLYISNFDMGGHR